METADAIITWLITNLPSFINLVIEFIIIGYLVKAYKYLAGIYKEVYEINMRQKLKEYKDRQAREFGE